MDKKFCTENEQIELLKNRGLIITDDKFAKNIIKKENYYKLINGYKKLFIDTYNQQNEIYKQNTNFNEIYWLYIFDRDLKNIFIKYILQIENTIKAYIANEFSMQYGHKDYLKIDNFDTFRKRKNPKAEIMNLISILQKEIASQLSKNNPMISHYISKYGYIPLWVLINKLTLGTVSKFYENLKQKEQDKIAKELHLKREVLEQFLNVLPIFRNACAHDERFYNFKSYKQIKDDNIHKQLNIKKIKEKDNTYNYIYGKKDLFAVVIIFKYLLNEDEFNSFFYKIKNLLLHLKKHLYTINIDEIIKEMGFPNNWYNIKNI